MPSVSSTKYADHNLFFVAFVEDNATVSSVPDFLYRWYVYRFASVVYFKPYVNTIEPSKLKVLVDLQICIEKAYRRTLALHRSSTQNKLVLIGGKFMIFNSISFIF